MSAKHIADAETQFLIVSVTPDFCRVGDTVVPFDIVQTLQPEKESYSKTVFARDEKILLIDSIVRAVKGNAGSGVLSGVSLGTGHSKVTSGSPTLIIEGRKTARHLDEVEMNGNF